MDPRTARRARALERAMPGEPVADASWRIALGEASGAISWAEHLRILAAVQEAAAVPAPPGPFAGRRRGGRFNCDAAG
jgi:hypothetical protein